MARRGLAAAGLRAARLAHLRRAGRRGAVQASGIAADGSSGGSGLPGFVRRCATFGFAAISGIARGLARPRCALRSDDGGRVLAEPADRRQHTSDLLDEGSDAVRALSRAAAASTQPTPTSAIAYSDAAMTSTSRIAIESFHGRAMPRKAQNIQRQFESATGITTTTQSAARQRPTLRPRARRGKVQRCKHHGVERQQQHQHQLALQLRIEPVGLPALDPQHAGAA